MMPRGRQKEISPSMDAAFVGEQSWDPGLMGAVQPKTSQKIVLNDVFQSTDEASGTTLDLHVVQKIQGNVLVQQKSCEADVDMRVEESRDEEGCRESLGVQFTKKSNGLVQPKPCGDDVDMRDEDVDCSKKKKVLRPVESPEQQNVRLLAPAVAKRKSAEMEKYVDEGTSYGVPTNHKNTKAIIDQLNNKNCNLRLKTGGTLEDSTEVVYDKTFSGYDWPKVPDYFKKTHEGSFGSVAPFKDEKTKKEFVMKKFKVTKESALISINEIEIPLSFKSNRFIGNVVALGCNNGNGYLVMDDNGDNLSNVIKICLVPNPQKWQIFKQQCVKPILLDMLKAFNALGRAGVVHRDVKPENFCLKWCPTERRYVAKLIDFGSSQTSHDPPKQPGGITCEYLPPSFNAMFCNWLKTKTPLRQLTHKDDIWAVGMTIVFTQLGAHPMIQRVTGLDKCPPNYTDFRMDVLAEIGKMKQLPETFFSYPECREIEPVLRRMLTLDDSERPVASELLNMLEGPKRVPLPAAKRMKVETPPGSDNHDLPQNLSAMTICKSSQQPGDQKQFGNRKLVYIKMKQEQPKMFPKCTLTPDQLAINNSQPQEYTVIDKSVLKLQHGPTNWCGAQPVAVFHNQAYQTKRQQKVEPEFVSPNGPGGVHDEYEDLVDFFDSTDKGAAMSPMVQPKAQQAKPTITRESSVIDLGQRSKPVTNRQCPVEFQRQPSIQFGQPQVGQVQQHQVVFRFQGQRNTNQGMQGEQSATPAFNLHFRAQGLTKPGHGAPGFTLQGQPRAEVGQQDPVVYHLHNQSQPQGAPDTTGPQGVAGNVPDFDQLFAP